MVSKYFRIKKGEKVCEENSWTIQNVTNYTRLGGRSRIFELSILSPPNTLQFFKIPFIFTKKKKNIQLFTKINHVFNFLFQKMLSMTCVDDFLNKAFFKIGLVVGRHPGYFVIVPFLLGCICLTGYQQIRYEIDPEYLFSPINGPGKTERAIAEEHFRVNYSDRFSIARITRPGKFFV